MTLNSTISSSIKSTRVSPLGKDIGQLLKSLLATTESPTEVVTAKGLITSSGITLDFLDTRWFTDYKVAQSSSKNRQHL